jgi:hypothetical protein
MEIPTNAANLMRTSAKTSWGTLPIRRNPRWLRSSARTWSTRTDPTAASPSGNGTLVGHGRRFEVIGQTMASELLR